MNVSNEERHAIFEELWNEPGMAFWFKNFRDLVTSPEANDTVAAFISEKIRDRVHDPDIADRLIPKDHRPIMKRPPMETDYYEVFNRDNVALVDLYEEPIMRFVPSGIETTRATYAIDTIIFATGFDAVTGAFSRIDIRGAGGARLREHWVDGPRTYLGLQVTGFPNMFIVGGPQSITGNAPRCSEFQVDWITDCMSHMRGRGLTRVEASADAEEGWVRHVNGTVEGTLMANANSWSFGSNVPGKKRAFLGYAGGIAQYRTLCADAAKDGFRGFVFDAPTADSAAARLT
jgi:cation diffusion facilitator CzcD-associated flavoprotein CzcO